LPIKINSSKEKIKSIYEDWLYQTNQIIQDKVSQYSKTVDVTPKRIVIKNLKNSWDSVTKNETINLKVNLIKAPDEVIYHIIIHGLCHSRIKGHPYNFWNHLNQFVPIYQKKINWLKRNSDRLV
jgi:predicted metal-dependent hydrolase